MAKKKRGSRPSRLKGAKSGYPTGGGPPGMTPEMQSAMSGPGPFAAGGPPGGGPPGKPGGY
jgi:hypothetical protein